MSEVICPITKARKDFLRLSKKAKELGEKFILTNKGEPEVVIMSYEEYESWRETLEILSDKKLMEGIRRGEEDIKRGKLHTHKEIFGEKG